MPPNLCRSPVLYFLNADQFYNFQAKYDTGGSLHSLPADISDKAFNTCMENALTMHESLGCRGISRSDFILDENTGNIFFLEINTQPGMTPTSLVPEQLPGPGSALHSWFLCWLTRQQ
ncbi:hypothetical protein LFZ16_00005 [Salmonella enterica subsp. enterica serovar India str. SA20085604]|nr:hypothetical protein LFZ16_00005 [Salmonella enterica subsp. enterica serovar India str. SA20085604]